MPFNLPEAMEHARIVAAFAAVGKKVGRLDSIIAATATCHDFAVLTGNVREFSQVEGLRVLGY